MSGEKKRQGGFSLVELLVAMMILSVALLGLAELQVSAMKQNAQSARITAAISLAQMIVEDVMNRQTDDPLFRSDRGETNWTTLSPMPSTPPVFVVAVPGAGSFRITFETSSEYEGVDNLCRVTVHVRSTTALMGLGSQTRPVTMTTIKRFAPAA